MESNRASMTKEEIKAKAEECCITEDEVRGFCRGAWWAQKKWVSVDTLLPADSDRVLCLYENKPYIGNYNSSRKLWFIDKDFWFLTTTKVTHWMLFPALPKDE